MVGVPQTLLGSPCHPHNVMSKSTAKGHISALCSAANAHQLRVCESDLLGTKLSQSAHLSSEMSDPTEPRPVC